jgi:hypothetical protein
LLGGGFQLQTIEQDVLSVNAVFVFAIFLGGALVGKGSSRGFLAGVMLGLLVSVLSIPFLIGSEEGKYISFVCFADVMLCGIGGWYGSLFGPQARLAVDDEEPSVTMTVKRRQ